MVGRLEGKVALISGAASGMGAAHARAIVREGGRVAIADIADDAGEKLSAELGDTALYVRLNVTSAEDWATAVERTESHFGLLNVLVNNAGILNFAPLGQDAVEAWDRTIAINLTGPFLGLTAALPALKRARPSSVINISSAAGLRGIPAAHGYTASKFGLRGLTKSAALELADSGVRVNSVHPGGVRTPMLSAFGGGEGVVETSLLKRLGEPEEISAMVVFLASDESSFSTGSEFVIDGGTSAGLVGS
ncbi:SDR family oxidoreductase [Amnibacterium flavum]|uniref:3-alpha-hydroxysteroid dehydrogenase n=1 Tax=Amnibacterium flavum TaxID=2173173 RepID=A0A2V1HT25_9MICO|nr:glucose 1-dehydrogenase [Amnibacterium flavum]PVZ93234.1 3-alpha-hydroxysteroid dehydrogenase [Amnibacterium flavum]